MRPKPPSSTNTPKVSPPTSTPTGPTRTRPDVDAPSLHPRPLDSPTQTRVGPDQRLDVAPDTSNEPSHVDISESSAIQPGAHTAVSSYLLNPGLLRNMQVADNDGFRFVVGRRFVDVKDIGTVHVEFDAHLGAYRVTDLYKKLPPGPVLYKNAGEATWSPAHQADAHRLKRPHPAQVDDESAGPAKQPSLLPPTADDPRDALLGDYLKQLYPQMTHGERVMLLRSYNLSPKQQVQLRDDLMVNPKSLPQWTEQHKLQTLDPNNPARFDAFHQEIEPLLLPLRNGTLKHLGWYYPDQSVSKEFLDAFLNKLGYLRNSSDCLYRTDIPGLFRADERTPFEFYNDGLMLPRLLHPRGATTAKPISATISLKEVKGYAGKGVNPPDPEYLRYNNQKNLYPGKKPGESDNDSGHTDDRWSDASIELDPERNYETIRHDQQVVFSYIIDTRNMEVVSREENVFLNLGAEDRGAWFPEDPLESLISASRSGISSDRLWLLDSTHTRAAKVEDVADQAGYNLRISIEADTHRGAHNRNAYDALIDAAGKAGRPILKFDGAKEWFANDIVWPE
jgi:hypothetical protein